MSKKIRALIVNDSFVAIKLMNRILESDSDFVEIKSAFNGREAVDLINKGIQFDIILMDLHMPILNGVEAIKEILSNGRFVPILVATTSVKRNAVEVFDAINLGALDAVKTPVAEDIEEFVNMTSHQICEKERMFLSKVKGIARIRNEKLNLTRKKPDSFDFHNIPLKDYTNCKFKPGYIIVIGSSTGGPSSLNELLSHFPASFNLPIVIAQHISRDFIDGLCKTLQLHCHLPVKKAKAGETIENGNIYFADHEFKKLSISKDKKFRYITIESHLYTPSVDEIYSSASVCYRDKCICLILSGMGKDGTNGLKVVKENKGIAYAQKRSSCVAPSMPTSAIESGLVKNELELQEIARTILLSLEI